MEPPRRAETPAERTERLLLQQARACAELGSPLYAALLRRAADDLRRGGPTAGVLQGHLSDPGRSALALRMLGGVHRLVLSGQAPELAAWYPSAGGTADPGPGAARAWAALQQVLAEHRDAVRASLDQPPQTNEVGRGAALIGGLCHLLAGAELPVRLVEIGASAGLNLRADRFHVPGEAGIYGDPASPVVLQGGWRGQPPPAAAIEVIGRSGGDLRPLDPVTAEGRLTLESYLWPDQPGRLARLRGALALAAAIPVDLRREPASATLARTGLAEGSWTVLWHSVVAQYLDRDEHAAVAGRVSELGAAATRSARFAHLYLEPSRGQGFRVRLSTWPGGQERDLGTASPHGIPVTWAPAAIAGTGSC